MKMSRLQEKLKNLDLNEIHCSAAAGKVPSEFIKIAELVLNGHFLVSSTMGCIKIYPTCVEIYWHEEQGDINDHIVYHRNSAESKPQIFSHGVLHNHISGIDLTFEQGDNPESAIRASMLIREYKKLTKSGEIISEKRPTYLYEDLYGQFSVFNGGFNVKWEEDENAHNTISDADCTPRYNVAQYKENNKGENVKELAEETADSKTANGRYVQDERRWRFTLNDHDTRF